MKNFLILILKGTAVGGANVMPGVSGATLAVILRIYDELIKSINNLFTDMKNSLRFLIPVAIGMVVGILAIGELANFLLLRFSLQTGGFIAGLMAGSLPFIHGQAVLKSDAKKNFAAPNVFAFRNYFIAIAAAFLIIFISLFAPEKTAEAQSAEFSAGLAAFLFVGGAVAAATMVIPGISGAMVLILFGLYPLVLHTITEIREYLMSPTNFQLLGEILVVVLPLGFGIVAGIFLGSKIIALLLEKFHSATYFAIFGLVLGTVFAVFKNPATYQSHETISAGLIVFTMITFLCGTFVSLRLAKS